MQRKRVYEVSQNHVFYVCNRLSAERKASTCTAHQVSLSLQARGKHSQLLAQGGGGGSLAVGACQHGHVGKLD